MVKKLSPRVKKKREVARQKILKVAYEVFCQKGYEGTTIEEIAGKVGLVKSALFYYFRNKEELFIEVIKFMAEGLFGELSKVNLSGLPPSEAGILIFQYSCRMLFKNPEFFSLFLPIQFSGRPAGAIKVLRRFRKEVYLPGWESVLNLEPQQREMLLRVVWSLFLGVCHFYLGERKKEAEEFMKEAEDVIRKTFA